MEHAIRAPRIAQGLDLLRRRPGIVIVLHDVVFELWVLGQIRRQPTLGNRHQAELQSVRHGLAIQCLEQSSPEASVSHDGGRRIHELRPQIDGQGQLPGVDPAVLPLLTDQDGLVRRETAP